MSTVLKDFDWSKYQTGRGYRSELFDRILDGQSHDLRHGTDYDIPDEQMIKRIRAGAHYRKVRVRILNFWHGQIVVEATGPVVPRGPNKPKGEGGGSIHEWTSDKPPDPRTRKGAIEILRREREDIARQEREANEERERVAAASAVAANDQGKPPDGQPD